MASTNKHNNFLVGGYWGKWSALLTKNMLPAGVLFINLAMHHIANCLLIFVLFSFLAISQIKEEKSLYKRTGRVY